jgi:hypothetical protein
VTFRQSVAIEQTSFDSALTQMKAVIDKPGDGSTQSQAGTIVLFVLDGVGDSQKANYTNPRPATVARSR